MGKWWQPLPLVVGIVASVVVAGGAGVIPTTLDGPFDPMTSSLDGAGFRGRAVDLPDTDPRVRRRARGFEPEQISVSLSATPDSVWISWVTANQGFKWCWPCAMLCQNTYAVHRVINKQYQTSSASRYWPFMAEHLKSWYKRMNWISRKDSSTGNFQIGEDIKPLDPTSVASIVHYGRLRRPLTQKAVGHSLVYNQLYPFEGLQKYTSGIIHHVRLTGLKAGSKYYYRCGDPSLPAMSDVHFFNTMPTLGPRSYPKRIAVTGDLGLTYNTTSTVDHMRSNKPDLVVLVGDVSYADLYLTNGTGSDCYHCSFKTVSPVHESYQPRWDYWGRFMEPLISKIPLMVVEGNHEIERQIEGKMFEAYNSRFAFPAQESGSLSTFYYSFNAGGIHFVMLGAYISYNRSGEQYKWLERDLANVDRTVTPWLIATWHPPWYSTYKSHYMEAECMRVEMEDLLYSYGVDIVFNGHVHAYERSNRIYNYTLDPCGPLYITVGDGGNRENVTTFHADDPGQCPEPLSTHDKHLGGFCATNFTGGPAAGKFCWERQPEYSAYRESSFGHGILEVMNETHALWTWHRNQDLYNSTGDAIYVVRQPDKCPVQPLVAKPRKTQPLISDS